jgi:AsmA protein
VTRLALWVGTGAAALVVLLILAVLALPHLVDLPRVQALVAANASQSLGRSVRFSSVSARLLPTPAVELHGLVVAEDPRFGTAPFVTLERGFLSLRLRPLLAGRLEFGKLTLERPLIRVVESADGRLNVASLGWGQHTPAAPAGREPRAANTTSGTSLLAAGLAIEKGVITFVSHSAAGEYRLVDVSARLRSDGAALLVSGTGLIVPGDIAVRLTEGSIAVGRVGSLSEAPLRGHVSFESADVGALVASLTPAGISLSGRVSGTLSLAGVVGSPRASGQVLFPAALVSRTNPECRPPERTLRVDDASIAISWADGRLVSRPVAIKVAGGETTANVALTLAGGLLVALSDISVRGLPLERVLVEFLCDAYAVTGPLDLSGSLTARAPHALESLEGGGRFTIGRGRVVGASALKLFGDVVKAADLAASAVGEEIPSPFEFTSITGGYRIRNGVVSTRDLLYTGRGFSVAMTGDYALVTGRLDFDLTMKYRGEHVKARVTGTTKAPVLRVDALGTLREVDSRTLERGLRDLLRQFR